MAEEARLGMDIMQAVSLREDAARIGALRRLAHMLHENETRPIASLDPQSPLALDGDNAEEGETSYRRVADLAILRPIHELDIMAYVAEGETDCAVQVLARLARLPVTTAFRLFSLQRADFLLVVCRAQGFAWSTTERLLVLFRGVDLTREAILALCDDYHDMPVATAQRFGRFLCAHFRTQPPLLS